MEPFVIYHNKNQTADEETHGKINNSYVKICKRGITLEKG